jgi:hypothetical protein
VNTRGAGADPSPGRGDVSAFVVLRRQTVCGDVSRGDAPSLHRRGGTKKHTAWSTSFPTGSSCSSSGKGYPETDPHGHPIPHGSGTHGGSRLWMALRRFGGRASARAPGERPRPGIIVLTEENSALFPGRFSRSWKGHISFKGRSRLGIDERPCSRHVRRRRLPYGCPWVCPEEGAARRKVETDGGCGKWLPTWEAWNARIDTLLNDGVPLRVAVSSGGGCSIRRKSRGSAHPWSRPCRWELRMHDRPVPSARARQVMFFRGVDPGGVLRPVFIYAPRLCERRFPRRLRGSSRKSLRREPRRRGLSRRSGTALAA